MRFNRDINTITLTGRIVTTPELKVDGKLCTFRFAHNRWNKSKKETEADFYTVNVWQEERAEHAMQVLAKGMALVIEGRQEIQTWTDKNDEEKLTVVIHANGLMALGDKNFEKKGEVREEPAGKPGGHGPDDLPF
jgi:single-strand DNA-binding protein